MAKTFVKKKSESDTQVESSPPATISDQEIALQLQDNLDWLEHMSDKKQFSQEWLLESLKEILFQCMGKKSVLLGGKVSSIFREKSALKSIELIAQLQGFLVMEKGKVVHNNINVGGQPNTIDVTPTVQLDEQSNERTEEVLRILQESGAFQPEPDRLT